MPPEPQQSHPHRHTPEGLDHLNEEPDHGSGPRLLELVDLTTTLVKGNATLKCQLVQLHDCLVRSHHDVLVIVTRPHLH